MRSRFIRALTVCVVIGLLIHRADHVRAVSGGVVISQVYGGGGNAGTTYKNDFIELFNGSGSDVNLTGWTVQYASAAGTTWTNITALSGTIQAGHYYLIQEAAGTGGTTSLPTPDVTGAIAMSATNAKVALVNTTAALSGGCPTGASIVDFVGYGTGTSAPSCFETAPAPTLTNTTADSRTGGGCTDSNNNGADFTSGAPNPRNSSSPINSCGGPTNPSGTGSATPNPVTAGNSTLLKVTVTPGTNPASTGLAVATDISSIGGSATQQFFDDGSHGDVAVGDNTFSFQATVPAATAAGSKTLNATITDTNTPPRSGSATISLTVTPASTSPTGVGAASPNSLPAASDTLLTVTVTPGTNPTSTGLLVVGDLNAIGGSASQQFYDDATHSDAVAGNNVFSFMATIPAGIATGAKSLPIAISDAQSRSGATTIALTVRPPGAGKVMINEIDADTPGNPDQLEFIELYDGGIGNTPLDGLVVVLYNGTDTDASKANQSYAAFDLNHYSTDANGYFVLGNPGVAGAGIVFDPGPFGLLQNGPDAVALYIGGATDFPSGATVTTTNLLDAIVYGTDDAAPSSLMPLINSGQKIVNENAAGNGTAQSSQRCPNGMGGFRNTSPYYPGAPTPGTANNCPTPRLPSDVVISQIYGGGNNTGATFFNDFVELYNRGADPVDLTGWSLQYSPAASNGSSFLVQPIGGSIGVGEYYLIQLASGTADPPRPPLPVDPNIIGNINISSTAGKVALVNSFDALLGGCPIYDPRIMDFVGYGTADCSEGPTTAPGLSNTTADFRKAGGIQDTDVNGNDFGPSAAPNPRRTAVIVELGPFVFRTDPFRNGLNAPRDATIDVTFTEAVTVDPGWFNITCASGQHNSATFASSFGGQDQYITPNDNFTAGEQCTVTILKDRVHDVDLNDTGPDTDTLKADYSWSFTVATGTEPPFSPSVHLTMGNPGGAGTDPNNYLMQKPEFALSYNRDLGRPNWVSWHLSSEWTGTLTRVDTFRPDPQVPPDWYRVQSFDFSGSGFDRGHMTPNADRDKETSVPINQATFLMSNMVAQAPGNNQGPWASLEGYLRTLTDDGTNEIYIVAGPEGTGGTGSNTPATITTTLANGHVTVPARTWKVALVLPKDPGDDVSRVSCSSRTIAVIMPNDDGIRPNAWETYLTTVDAVETLTGYDLFSNLPEPIQRCVEAGLNGDNPPGVSCAAPDSAWHADNVSLACTATPGGSELANPADASFSLSTSVDSGAENANASTDSRTICDIRNHCIQAGPIAGNKIDRKAPGVSCASPDGLWHADNVALACTASDLGLINPGDAAFSLVTSVASGVEDPNAATDSRTVCDGAGNCSTAGPITGNMVDRRAPSVICASPDGLWHADNVTLACTAADGGTGLGNASDASFSLVTSIAAGVEDGNAATNSRNVCDTAGNCTTAGPVTGNMIDRKAPVVSCASPDGAWHVSNVSLTCTAGDAGAGLANAADASFFLVTSIGPNVETANASTDSRVVCDARGNCATAGPIAGNKIDRKAPVITLTTPANGAVYPLNETVAAAYACSDGSGTTCTGTVANLAPIDTSSIGSKTFTVSATDGVGNSSSATATYTVKRMLSAVGPAKTWIGLKNSDDVGLRVDLRAQVLVNGVVAATGELLNVATGSSGFSNAILQSIPMSLASGPVEVPRLAVVSFRVDARRTCSPAVGHSSGTVREWYNGEAVDTGTGRDAGSRIMGTLGGHPGDLFQRPLFLLLPNDGNVRMPADVSVNSSASCPARPYLPFGIWSIIVP